MKTLYYDCFAGISGDMNLAAMIDIGVNADSLVSELKKLGLGGWEIKNGRDSRGGIEGTILKVLCKEEHHHHEGHGHNKHHHHEHRTFAQIKKIIEGSGLSAFVKEKSVAIFKTIAEAEAKVHGKPVDEVHFHEVGAVDSIIDIVGAAICAEMLGIEKFAASTVELGGGTVRCRHGLMPVPAPATAIMAERFPSKIGGASHECTTPTGAAIIATLCDSFNPKISGKIIASGIGVGHRQSEELPNILRVMIIDSESTVEDASFKSDSMFVLSANIDDMTGEALACFVEKLFECGALDAWQESIVMKKGRLASKVCALSNKETLNALRACYFKHSSTLGIRVENIRRDSIERGVRIVKTSFGEVNFKVSKFEGSTRVKPEFEDLKRIACERNIPLWQLEKKLLLEFGDLE